MIRQRVSFTIERVLSTGQAVMEVERWRIDSFMQSLGGGWKIVKHATESEEFPDAQQT